MSVPSILVLIGSGETAAPMKRGYRILGEAMAEAIAAGWAAFAPVAGEHPSAEADRQGRGGDGEEDQG